jgi:dephospho-CoA kinase
MGGEFPQVAPRVAGFRRALRRLGMLTVAVTGGIGAGKSTVSALLAELGAVVIDSDVLARQVAAPGTAGLAAVVDAFGDGVLAADGSLDRGALAADRVRRRGRPAPAGGDHTSVGASGVSPITGRRGTAAIPGRWWSTTSRSCARGAEAAEFDLVVAVVADEAVRVERLIRRGLAEADARARIAAQISDDERRTLADAVIENHGDESELRAAVRRLWSGRILPLAARTGPAHE